MKHSKPSWNSAPYWAEFLAMNENGVWFWYEIEPTFNHNSRTWEGYGKVEMASGASASLESRPKTKE